MDGDADPGSYYFSYLLLSATSGDYVGLAFQVFILLGLLFSSALISGSEVAFFSLKGEEQNELKGSGTSADNLILELLEKPKRLLATILIANNVINIAIVVLSSQIAAQIFTFKSEIAEFVTQVVLVTFLLVLLGEVTPKVYAQKKNIFFARFMAIPMRLLITAVKPFSLLLIRSSSFFEKRISHYQAELSKEELHEAIELTSDDDTSQEEKNILKGIVNFGNISVKQIMRPRPEVEAYGVETPFSELKQLINEHRYSRIPIYDGDLDNVEGILHVKDLLPHLESDDTFNWLTLLRKPYFVPEMKQIDDLLKEFQTKKMHMAIVVDEYGGTEGIVTLEDVLEEIVGEIHDEFDDNEVFYSKLDDSVYVFDGKTSISDLQKIIGLEPDTFDEFRNEVESIGGLVVELHGKVPKTGEEISFERFEFKVESADQKKVRRVKITVHEAEEDND